MLAAQRAYADSGPDRAAFGLLVPEAFVRGIRHIGYRGTSDAIAELIDNAIQACADRVDICFGYDSGGSSRKPAQLAVIDNGHGMDPGMIRLAMMWGGSHRENDRSGLGRFGYGLPCASVSLGRRFTVYSKVADGIVHAATLDLDVLAAGGYTNRSGAIVVPSPQNAPLPAFVIDRIESAYPDGWNSGTVVVIDKLDRLEWSTCHGLRENLCRAFGVTYHKLRKEVALFVDGAFVAPVDPLFLTPGFHLFDHDEERAIALDPIEMRVDGAEPGGCPGTITLRYAWLPPGFGSVDKGRDAVGLNANPRFAVIRKYHGLIFSRNGRLIDVQTRTPWTTFINNDRYIKIEVEFTATLDGLFGVTTSKQQVTPTRRGWDVLRQAGLPKAIEQLRAKVKDAKRARRPGATLRHREEARPECETSDGTGAAIAPGRQPGRDPSLHGLRIESVDGAPFFRIDDKSGFRALHLNAAHRFYRDIYAAPAATPDLRRAIENLLLCFDEFVLAIPFRTDGSDANGRFFRGLEHMLDRISQSFERSTTTPVTAPAAKPRGVRRSVLR